MDQQNAPNTNGNTIRANGLSQKTTEEGLKSTPASKTYTLSANKPLYGAEVRYSIYRALSIYLLGGFLGTYVWYTSSDPRYRVFGAGLILPGAGYLALSRWYLIAFVFNLGLFPVSLVGWFLVGIVPLPLGFHFGAAFVAGWLAKGRVNPDTLPLTPYVAWSINAAAIVWGLRKTFRTVREKEERRKERNQWLDEQVKEDLQMFNDKIEATELGQQELSLEQLQYCQHLVNLTRQPLESWEGWSTIDQFRESAYRYQIYYLVYILSAVQCNVTPNFHGYISEAQVTAIKKCLLPAVQYYWALESIWGRFSLRWDPIEIDNIMVTGWFFFAIMAYTSTTRDMRFGEPGSLVFQVTAFHHYPHSIHTMAQVLVNNWRRSQFCLYSCEPNWVYTACNAYGAVGAQMYDRVVGAKQFESIKASFVKGWKDNFVFPDGNILTFMSSILGITFESDSPSVLGYTIMICRDYLPDYTKQLTAIFRREKVKKHENGNVVGINTGPMDAIDPGTYRIEAGGLFGKSWSCMLAKEIGDDDVARFVEAEIDNAAEIHSDDNGGVYAGPGSNLTAIAVAGAKLNGFNFWNQMISTGPPEHTFEGPLLAHVAYAEVLVAKAWSNGNDLDLVLYDGQGKLSTVIELERLKPGRKYIYGGGQFIADAAGRSALEVDVDGRTQIIIKLVE